MLYNVASLGKLSTCCCSMPGQTGSVYQWSLHDNFSLNWKYKTKLQAIHWKQTSQVPLRCSRVGLELIKWRKATEFPLGDDWPLNSMPEDQERSCSVNGQGQGHTSHCAAAGGDRAVGLRASPPWCLCLPAPPCRRCERHPAGSAWLGLSHLKFPRVHFCEELQNQQTGQAFPSRIVGDVQTLD